MSCVIARELTEHDNEMFSPIPFFRVIIKAIIDFTFLLSSCEAPYNTLYYFSGIVSICNYYYIPIVYSPRTVIAFDRRVLTTEFIRGVSKTVLFSPKQILPKFLPNENCKSGNFSLMPSSSL